VFPREAQPSRKKAPKSGVTSPDPSKSSAEEAPPYLIDLPGFNASRPAAKLVTTLPSGPDGRCRHLGEPFSIDAGSPRRGTRFNFAIY
jgi:hypothetical protein